MDYQQIFAVSAAGMNVERTRVDVAALNLANAHTVGGAGHPAYQPMQVVVRAGGASFGNLVADAVSGAPVATVESNQAAPQQVYEPNHPEADVRGFVSYPGVDSATEMVNIMSAMRGYEANVAAMNATRTLALKALEIGGGA